MSATRKLPQLIYGHRNATGTIDDMATKIKSGLTIHSLRGDTSKLFTAGTTIQLLTAINQATKHYHGQLKVTGYQQAVLRGDGINVTVTIDGRLLTGADMVLFYRNEGFNSLDDFLKWYLTKCENSPNKTLKLKLVHWTDFRY